MSSMTEQKRDLRQFTRDKFFNIIKNATIEIDNQTVNLAEKYLGVEDTDDDGNIYIEVFDEDIKLIANTIEKCIFNYTITSCKKRNIYRGWEEEGFFNIYRDKYLTISANLNPNGYVGNKELLVRVLEKKVPLYTLVSEFTSEQMFPERWREARIREQEKMNKIINLGDPNKMPDGMFRCGKCKSKKTSYYQLQTKSADEPMSNFHFCMLCGNRWKS